MSVQEPMEPYLNKKSTRCPMASLMKITSALLPAAVLFLVLLPGCSSRAPEEETGKVYLVRGQVIRIIADGAGMRCAHEEIPGLMGAMRMDFQIRSGETAADLRPGDKIRFSYRVTDLGGYAYDIEKLPQDTRLALPEELLLQPGEGAPRQSQDGEN